MKYKSILKFLVFPALILMITFDLKSQDSISTEAQLEKSIAVRDFSAAAILSKRIYNEQPANEKNPSLLFRAAEYYAKVYDKKSVLATVDTAIKAGYTNIYNFESNLAFNFIRNDSAWVRLGLQQRKIYQEREDIFYWGLYYGLMTVLFLLNLFLFFSGREISYLFFCLLLLADAQWELIQNFSEKVYFVKLIPWMKNYNLITFPSLGVVITFLLILFYALFSKSFLKLKEKLPRLNMFLNVALISLSVYTILAILKIKTPEIIVIPIVMATFLLCLIAGIICWYRGVKEARFYVSAAIIFTISLFLPKPPILFVYSLLNIGLMLFYVILTLALADKMKIMRLEKEHAQEKAFEALEEKVQERTEEVVKQKHIIEEKQMEILDSISYAKRLQEAILPSREFVGQNIPVNFIYYQPKDIVAGDFYWAQKVGEYFYVAAADSTGHGVPGAMVSVVCSNALNRSVKEFKETETGKILDKTRELVIETFEKSESEVKDGMDISLIRISPLSPGEGTGVRLQWSGAYNPLWFYVENEFKEVKANKQPIGRHDDPVPFTTHSLTVPNGTTFYLFSDGYADQFSPADKKLMTRKFKEILTSVQHLSLEEQGKQLEKFHDDWKGNMEQTDDVLVIGIKV